ncbi:MAG TPA: PAS domain-containing protein [Cytophagaceae bacterium]|jgi:PAS domain S-box-containing protein
MKDRLTDFKLLPEYAAFLIDNHLDDLVKKDLARSKDIDLPLLKFLSHLSEDELFELSKKGILEYLQQLVDGTAVEAVDKSMDDWKANKLDGVGRADVVASDIALIYNVRKHSLIDFTPLYTTDIPKILSIIKEVEDFYTYQESIAIDVFSQINKEELAKSELRLREAQGLAKLGYWDFDIETNAITWSDELYEIYRINKETNLTTDLIRNLVFNEDVEELFGKIKDIYKNGGSFTHEYRIRDLNGNVRYLIDKGYVEMVSPTKKVLKGISQDITERKVVEESLKLREAQLSEAQAIAHLGSWEWDLEENRVSWSEELYRIFGYGPGEMDLDFQSYMNHIHPSDRERLSALVTECVTHGKSYSLSHRIFKKDGTLSWLQGKGQVSVRKDGKIVRLSGTGMDISEQRKAEEAIEQKTEALLASNKELEAFCYTISHDLRSPLRAIDGFGRKLANGYEATLDKEGQRLLNVVRSNAQQMGVLIDSLLDFSRLNRKEIKRSVLQMEALVQRVTHEIKEQQPDHQATIQISPLIDIRGDQDLMHQVWHNLIANAVKFTSKVERPLIEVGAERIDGRIVFYVKDNGAGFEMEYKDKLFGVFQRLHTSDEFSGTGVGLATVQRIILRHGGLVWAEGEPNKGASFYFSFPESEEVIHKYVHS